MRRALFLGLALAACRRGPTFPATDRSDGALPALAAPRVGDGEIRVDGSLDEGAWARAGSTLGLVHPGNGVHVADSKVNAEARVLWSDARLFVAVRVWDPSPQRAFARDAEDPHVWERESGVEVMLQPGDPGDNRDYVELQVGASGALWATRFDDYNAPVRRGPDGAARFGHQEWSPRVERAVRQRDGYYEVELALPWADLPGARAPTPPRAGDVWRMNVYSFRDGQRDALAWSPIMGQGNFHRAARWGRVTFGR